MAVFWERISCHKNLSFSHKLRYDKNSNSSYAESIVDIMDTLVCTYFLPLFPHHRLATSWCCVDSAKIFSPHDVAPLWIMHTTGRRRIFSHSRMHSFTLSTIIDIHRYFCVHFSYFSSLVIRLLATEKSRIETKQYYNNTKYITLSCRSMSESTASDASGGEFRFSSPHV